MATEPVGLKRKRNPPTEWWAASPSTSTPPAAQVPQLRDVDRAVKPNLKDLARRKPMTGGDNATKKAIESAPSDNEDELGDVAARNRGPGRTGLSGVKKVLHMAGEGRQRIGPRNPVRPAADRDNDLDENQHQQNKRRPQPDTTSGPDIALSADVASNKRKRLAQKSITQASRVISKEQQPTANNTKTGGVETQGEGSTPLKKGRSSNTESELRKVVSYKEARTKRSSDIQPDGSKDSQSITKPQQPNTINSSLGEADAQGDTFTPLRKGRSSNTESELRKIVNYKEAKTRPKRPSDNSVEGAQNRQDTIRESRADITKTKSKRVGIRGETNNPVRKGRSSNTENELRTVMNYKDAKDRTKRLSDPLLPDVGAVPASSSISNTSLRRGRSSNTETEIRAAVNYKETKTSRRVVPLQNVQLQNINLGPSSSDKPQGKAQGPRQSLNTAIIPQRETTKKPNKARQRMTDVDRNVQAASSKLTKGRSGAGNVVKPIDSTKQVPGRKSSTRAAPAKSRKDIENSEGNAAAKSTNLPLSRKRKSQEMSQNAGDNQSSTNAEASQSKSAKRRRQSEVEQVANIVSSPVEKRPRYQHLAVTVHRVSRSTINKSWDPVPLPCIEQISQLVEDIQRPILVRLTDQKQRDQARNALQTISRKLANKMSKGLPFPRGTNSSREEEFNFEKILDHNRALESQLTPALHSNELLEAELAKELAWLESEQADLAELEANAKAASSKMRRDGSKVHPLLQPQVEHKGFEDDIGYRNSGESPPANLNFQDDEHLQSIAKNLQGHVDSIEGNMRQVEGISEAMTKGKAALQATLFEHLDSTRYEEVILG